MPEERILKTVIDPSVITELGKMYTTITQTLRELVQNSFDAKANNIYITIDIPNDYIEVIDDGTGMNDYVVENHYVNVGKSTKTKVIEQLPPIPPELNEERPNIGKKGMGKLSWILIAKEMETITTSIDIPHAIKVIFNVTDLELNKVISPIEKILPHGTVIRFKNIQIKDITEKDLKELENTVGFLHHAFPEFHIYLTVNSESTKINKKLIVKTLAEGYEIKTRGIYESPIIEEKTVEGYRTTKVVGHTDVPYDFVIRLPTINSLKIAEFWLLSGYIGVKPINELKKFSGYINIDNIELVANRNDIQSLEKNKYRKTIYEPMKYFFSQLELICVSNDYSKLEFIDINKNSLIDLIYDCPSGFEKIGKWFKFSFYGVGEKRLKDFLETENVIYFYNSQSKNKADKASYYGYKCFLADSYHAEYIVRNAFETGFVQDIDKLPKEAYEYSGTTIKPVGNLLDILKNTKKIFDSLTYAYNKLSIKVEELKRELEERADALTEEEKREREKEMQNLLEQLRKLQEEMDKGKKEEGETEKIEKEIPEKKKHYKKEKEKAFKQNEEHYIEMIFGPHKVKIGFVYIDNPKVIASIYFYKYIHLNTNNEYIKIAIEEKDPIKQLILLMPHLCHEVSHYWSSEHDETFQMMFNGLLVPALDNLLKTLFHNAEALKPEEFITEIKKEPEFKVKLKIKHPKS